MIDARLVPLLTALAVAPVAAAEVIAIDPYIGAAVGGPERNSTMPEVEARFGAPVRRAGPVGDPPITVWHYEQFKVYFEHDRVLHATSRKAGPPGPTPGAPPR